MSDKHYTHHDDQTHLEAALRHARPWLETNATFLIYGLAAVLAVAAGAIWFQRQPEGSVAASALFQEAAEPEDFQAIADEYGSTKLGQLARLNQATGLLNSASRNLFTDREAANAELEQADAAFSRLAETSSLDAMIHERVLIGQARLAEIRCDGSEDSIKAAASAWQTVLNEYDSSMAKVLAEGQIKALNDPDNAPFYTWFSALEPKAADDLNMPGLMPGLGGSAPGSTVPNVPANLTVPSLPETVEDTSAGDEPAADADSAKETPKPEASAEDAATPADETVTEEPAPSEESPADEPVSEEATTEEPSTPTEEPVVEESTDPAE